MNRYLEFLINTPPRFYLLTAKYKLAKKSLPENYNNISPCAFALSTGRVGTETLARLFEINKKINAVHEPLPKLFGLSKTCYNLSERMTTDTNVETALVEAFLTGRRDLLNYALYTSHGYIETGPHVTFAAPWIRKTIPDAKFIHMVREPKAVVTSGVRRKWYVGQINDQWRITPKPGTPFASLWGEMDQVEKLLWLWAETNQWILDFSRTLDTDQYLLVHSEEIFESNQATIHSLYSFLGVEIPSARRINRVLRKQINSQKTGSFKEPEDWETRINPNLADFVTKVAKELGYVFP